MIKKLFEKHPTFREMFLYGLIGGTSSTIDAVLFILLRKLNINILLANFISINTGIAISFILNTYINFKKSDNLKQRAISFFSIGYIGLLLSLIIMHIFVSVLGFNEIIVKIGSIIFVAIVQYILNKFITYGNKNLLETIKKDFKKENCKKILLYTSLLLLLYLFTPIIIALAGFVINIKITTYHFIVSVLFSLLICLLIAKKQKDTKVCIYSIIFSLLIMFLVIFVIWGLYDYSYDGVNYHLHTDIALLKGWNPLKEVLNTGYQADMNANHFAGKGVWLYAASIAKLFNNINVTKSYILISTISALMYVYYVLIDTKVLSKTSKMFRFMISFIIIFNPVITYQFMTNYTDVYMYNLVIILLFSLINITYNSENKISYLFAIISIIIMGNIKTTGIFFAFLFCLFFVLLWFKNAIINKKITPFIKKCVPLLIGGLLIFVIGVNPYFSNVKLGKNMFYPIFGNNKIDLVGDNCPKRLQNKNNVQQIYMSMTSVISNDIYTNNYSNKTPLTIKQSELYNESFDIRLSGWGPLFQLVMCITIILLLWTIILVIKNYNKIKNNKDVYLWLYTFASILIVGLVFPDAWWARYYPLFWILPVILLIALANISNSLKKISYISVSLISLMMFNNSLLFYSTFDHYNNQNKIIKKQLNYCKNKSCIIYTDQKLYAYTVRYLFEKNGTEVEFDTYDNANYTYRSQLLGVKLNNKDKKEVTITEIKKNNIKNKSLKK